MFRQTDYTNYNSNMLHIQLTKPNQFLNTHSYVHMVHNMLSSTHPFRDMLMHSRRHDSLHVSQLDQHTASRTGHQRAHNTRLFHRCPCSPHTVQSDEQTHRNAHFKRPSLYTSPTNNIPIQSSLRNLPPVHTCHRAFTNATQVVRTAH